MKNESGSVNTSIVKLHFDQKSQEKLPFASKLGGAPCKDTGLGNLIPERHAMHVPSKSVARG